MDNVPNSIGYAPNSIGSSDFIEVMAQGSPGAGVGPGAAAPSDFLEALLGSLRHNSWLLAPLGDGRGGLKDHASAALVSALQRGMTKPEPSRRPEKAPELEPSRQREPSHEPEPADRAGELTAEVAPAPEPDRADDTGPDEGSSARADEQGRARTGASSDTVSSEDVDERADATVEAKPQATHAKPAESPQLPSGHPEPAPERAGPTQTLAGDSVEPDAAPLRLPPEDPGEPVQPAEGGDGPPAKASATVPLEAAGEDVGGTSALVEESPDGLQPSSPSAAADAAPEAAAAQAEAGAQDVPLEKPTLPRAGGDSPDQTAGTANEEAPDELEAPSRETNANAATADAANAATALNAPGEANAPLDPRMAGVDAARSVRPEVGDGAAYDPPLASAEAEDALLHTLGSRVEPAAISLTASANAVGPVEPSLGADGAGDGGGQIGPRAFTASGLTPPGEGAAEAEVVEQLDGVFKQVLSTAALPLELRKRIELARSIGRQVIRGALVSVKNGRMHVQLQLRPPTLGTVRMQLTTEGKAVSARLSVENGLVREAVEQHLSQLRSVLRDEGFSLERFDVSVRRDGGSEPWASGHAEDQERHEAHAAAGEHEERYDDESDALLEAAASAASTHEGAVDYLA